MPLTPTSSSIRELVDARLADPEAFMKWSELLEPAERIGRIKKSKQSPLAYCLTRYVSRALTDVSVPDFRIYVDVDDGAFTIRWHSGDPSTLIAAQIPHPDWLFDFFGDEDRLDLLEPASSVMLMEVLQQIYEHCLERGHIKLPA